MISKEKMQMRLRRLENLQIRLLPECQSTIRFVSEIIELG